MPHFSTWSIKDFYKKSWALTLRHKKLWIIALALAVGSGGSGGGGGNSSSDKSTDSSQNDQVAQQEMVTNNSSSSLIEDSAVDLVEESKQFDNLFSRFIENDLKTTSTIFALSFLGLQFLILIAWGIVYGIVLRSWATAALIIGVSDADKKDTVDLTEISKKAMSRIKSIAWVSIIPGLYLTLAGLLTALIITVLLVVIKPPTLIMVLLVLVAVTVFVYAAVSISLSVIWAIRFVALENKKGKEAFNLGYKTIRGNVGKMLGLGFSNTVVSGLATIVILIPFGGIGLAAAVPAIEAQKFTLDLGITLVMLFLAMIPTMSLTNAAMNVFRFATWNYGFDLVKKDIK